MNCYYCGQSLSDSGYLELRDEDAVHGYVSTEYSCEDCGVHVRGYAAMRCAGTDY